MGKGSSVPCRRIDQQCRGNLIEVNKGHLGDTLLHLLADMRRMEEEQNAIVDAPQLDSIEGSQIEQTATDYEKAVFNLVRTMGLLAADGGRFGIEEYLDERLRVGALGTAE